MPQAKRFITAAALCTAGFLAGTVAPAATAPLVSDRTSDILLAGEKPAATTLPTPELDVEETTEVTEAEPLECPPGQFPSAFADVYPWEWAYEAINNLASPSMECFDLPEEVR
ncbi:MAG: hypothetical protein F6K00_00875 [Leptolyngbya sp. SIOISBB]|nr:hypothetical protein [Leptolyngbya sp. SIOISBB]